MVAMVRTTVTTVMGTPARDSYRAGSSGGVVASVDMAIAFSEGWSLSKRLNQGRWRRAKLEVQDGSY